jgi:hypothetical protein
MWIFTRMGFIRSPSPASRTAHSTVSPSWSEPGVSTICAVYRNGFLCSQP